MSRQARRRAALPVLCLLLAGLASPPARADIEVDIDGLDGDELTNVEQRLRIRTAAKERDLDAVYVEGLHARAEQDIRQALQPFGYYQPRVEGKLEGQAPDWHARYKIDRGPATRIALVDVQVEGPGREDAAVQRALRHLPVKVGERLRHAEYEDTKTRLSRAAYAEGYLDAAFTRAELRVVPEEQRADLRLTLSTGPRYYFGEVTLEQDVVEPELARRYVRIHPGKPFDPQAVIDTQFALVDLDYFQTVEIEPQRERASGAHIPIVIRTTPRKRRKWDFGVGYGTDTGARVSVGTEVRRLNRRGHKIRGDVRLSEVKNTISGEYRIPRGDTPGEYWGFGGASETQRYDDGESFKYVLNTSLVRFVGRWQRKLYLNFEHEESELSDRVQTADLLMPGLSFDRIALSDPIHARRGWTLFTDLHGAEKGLLASASFVQGRAVARGVLPYARQGRVMARAEYGGNLVDRFHELPASQRFFAGGDQSVRGYRYQSLGPKDDEGKVLGGKFVATGSLETDYFFWPNWGLAAFYDLGGADDSALPKLSAGTGVGLRYRAPVGYLQVDVAWPLDAEDSAPRLHFGVRVGL